MMLQTQRTGPFLPLLAGNNPYDDVAGAAEFEPGCGKPSAGGR